MYAENGSNFIRVWAWNFIMNLSLSYLLLLLAPLFVIKCREIVKNKIIFLSRQIINFKIMFSNHAVENWTDIMFGFFNTSYTSSLSSLNHKFTSSLNRLVPKRKKEMKFESRDCFVWCKEKAQITKGVIETHLKLFVSVVHSCNMQILHFFISRIILRRLSLLI